MGVGVVEGVWLFFDCSVDIVPVIVIFFINRSSTDNTICGFLVCGGVYGIDAHKRK